MGRRLLLGLLLLSAACADPEPSTPTDSGVSLPSATSAMEMALPAVPGTWAVHVMASVPGVPVCNAAATASRPVSVAEDFSAVSVLRSVGSGQATSIQRASREEV